jgi:hypothetical protein
VPDDREQLDANVDYWNAQQEYFVRVDVELRRDSLYKPAAAGEDGDLTGYVALSADEALEFADELRRRAERVHTLNAERGDGA